MTVVMGIDQLRDDQFSSLSNVRVGLFSSSATVSRDLTRTVDILSAADNVQLVALFGAEHGFGGGTADGLAVDSTVDSRSNLPVHSLYGETYAPTPAMLADIDVLICDIQDIGVRYYTFVWTLTHILEACGTNNTQAIVLDRPNPLGGEVIRGRGLEPSHASFVGRYDLPIQHGLTIGEFAQFANQFWNPTPTELTIVPCTGWQRDMTWDALKQPFVPSSPNMPHLSTVQHYPGSCLIEGTSLSEGRGTPLPFEVVGAPGLDGIDLAAALNDLELGGIRFRTHQFRPNASKYAGQDCEGVQVHITNTQTFRPIETWLHVLSTIKHTLGFAFEWNVKHFDRLIGSSVPRSQLDANMPVTEIVAPWTAYTAEFREMRESVLLYD